LTATFGGKKKYRYKINLHEWFTIVYIGVFLKFFTKNLNFSRSLSLEFRSLYINSLCRAVMSTEQEQKTFTAHVLTFLQ
jgi:hypothetical protein